MGSHSTEGRSRDNAIPSLGIILVVGLFFALLLTRPLQHLSHSEVRQTVTTRMELCCCRIPICMASRIRGEPTILARCSGAEYRSLGRNQACPSACHAGA